MMSYKLPNASYFTTLILLHWPNIVFTTVFKLGKTAVEDDALAAREKKKKGKMIV
jgi:hypothetical protein